MSTKPQFCPNGHPIALLGLRRGEPCPGCLAATARAERVQALYAQRAKKPERCPRCHHRRPPANPGAALCRACSKLSTVHHLMAQEHA